MPCLPIGMACRNIRPSLSRLGGTGEGERTSVVKNRDVSRTPKCGNRRSTLRSIVENFCAVEAEDLALGVFDLFRKDMRDIFTS